MPKSSGGGLRAIWLVIVLLLLAAVYVSLTNGAFDLAISDVVRTLLRIDPVPEHDLVIFEFRLPRIVIALLVGCSLGVSGAVVQGITRNGLADPGILGIHAGAGAAIVCFMFFYEGQISGTGWFAVMAKPLFGLAGGLGAALFLYLFSWRNGTLDPQRLILVGIATGTGLGAVTLYLSLKMNPNDFEMATVWLTGSIWNADWDHIVSMLPWMVVLIPLILWKAKDLDLLQSGDDVAKGLGVPTEAARNILLLTSIGLVSASVSVSGSIGFVGLIAPHIAKRLAGFQHSMTIPLAGAVGMLLVVVADFIAKTVFVPVELPVGIVISLIGVPYFFHLLARAKTKI